MIDAAARAYADCFDGLERDTLDRLFALIDADIRFKDPFNDTRGAEAMIGVMRKMFDDTTAPRFATTSIAVTGDTAFVKWRFTCGVRVLGRLEFDGVSEVTFDRRGRATSHIDYWDAGSEVYARLPLLGGMLRLLRRRLAYQG